MNSQDVNSNLGLTRRARVVLTTLVVVGGSLEAFSRVAQPVLSALTDQYVSLVGLSIMCTAIVVMSVRAGANRFVIASTSFGTVCVLVAQVARMLAQISDGAGGHLVDSSTAHYDTILNALEKIPYDLVLMDIQMPEMDGYETTREIRRSDSRVINSSIPIIALTAYAMKRDQGLCMKVGMNDFVSKPIQLEVLKERIDRCISNTVASYMRP